MQVVHRNSLVQRTMNTPLWMNNGGIPGAKALYAQRSVWRSMSYGANAPAVATFQNSMVDLVDANKNTAPDGPLPNLVESRHCGERGSFSKAHGSHVELLRTMRAPSLLSTSRVINVLSSSDAGSS